MSKKKILILLLLVLFVGAGFSLKHLFRPSFSYAGTIEVTKVDIPARLMSVISEVRVHEGDRVEKGQTLMRLDCEDIKVSYDLAEKNFQRSAKLLHGGGLSRELYDQAKAKRDELQIRFGWCEINSPLMGTVLTKYHEAGEMVVPGAKLLTVGDLESVYAYFYLPHDRIAALKLNQEIQAELPEMDRRSFKGVIAYIDPEAEFTPKNVQTRDERTRLVFGVKVRFENKEGILKPGMTLEWHDDGGS